MSAERLFDLPEEYGLSVGVRASKEFAKKPASLQLLINQALQILNAVGIPLEETPRRVERMALALLAVADVKHPSEWESARDVSQGRSMSTRQIIEFWNLHLEEQVSPGSYDDVRRKDLLFMVEAGLIVPTHPDAARNAPHRGYAVHTEYADVLRSFGTPRWVDAVTLALTGKTSLVETLAAQRELARIPVTLSSGVELRFGPGEHNLLIRAVIEQFLPIFGHGAEVLYVGDAEKRDLFLDRARLADVRFFELDHGELPDVVAYSAHKGWLYVIEAVHSSGPITTIRRNRLKELLRETPAGVVFVTAFLNRASFRRWVKDIAWETEVWISTEPDHLIHFDGQRFLGPYPE